MTTIDSIGSYAKIDQRSDETMYLQVTTHRGLSENITGALHLKVRDNNNKNRRKFTIGINSGHDGGRRVTSFSFKLRDESEIDTAMGLWKQIVTQSRQVVDEDRQASLAKSSRMKSTLSNYTNVLEQVIGRKDNHE